MIRTLADSLSGADLGAILHAVDGEVNLGQWLLLLYGADGVVDLSAANILRARRTGAVGIHVESGGEGHERRGRGDTEMTRLETRPSYCC